MNVASLLFCNYFSVFFFKHVISTGFHSELCHHLVVVHRTRELTFLQSIGSEGSGALFLTGGWRGWQQLQKRIMSIDLHPLIHHG